MDNIAKLAAKVDLPSGQTFARAFAKMQAEIKPALKDSTNPHFRSKYADLSAIWDAIKNPLKTHGFSVLQIPGFDAEGVWLKTIILHESGESLEGRYPLRPLKEDPQGYGSALTYARRYSLSAMLGVVADEDDDGNAASTKPANPQRDAIHTPNTMTQDEDVMAGVRNWCGEQKTFLMNCETVADVQAWEELRAEAMDRLKRKSPKDWSEMRRFVEKTIGNINLVDTAPQ